MLLLSNFIMTVGLLVVALIIRNLLKQEENGFHKIILAIVFLLFFLVILYSYGELNDVRFIYTTTFVFADAIGFLLGPLLYLYIRTIYTKKNQIFPNGYFHFIPALLYIASISTPFLISRLKDNYLFDYLKVIDENQIFLQFQGIYLLLYLFLSILVLNRFKRISKNNFSNLSNYDVKWVKYLLYGMIVVILLNIALEFYSLLINGRLSLDNTLTTLIVVVLMVYLGYYGTGQSRILLPEHLLKGEKGHSKKELGHHLSNASEKEVEELRLRLYEVLEKDRPYENENLNLELLAELTGTTDRKLSALLNHKLNTTFYDLINSFRVEAVKEKMARKEYDKYTLLALAFDSGFNSKTSFNRIFKKVTGLSPSEYKKQF